MQVADICSLMEADPAYLKLPSLGGCGSWRAKVRFLTVAIRRRGAPGAPRPYGT